MTAEQIAASLRAHADRLYAVARILEGDDDLHERLDEAAPYGLKADGTPFKCSPEARAKQSATIRRRAERRRPKLTELDEHRRLRVLSSTHPTPAELKDRTLAHSTEEPAG